MRSRGHSVDCAKAVVTTPDECKCLCEGAFHGGPGTARARALVWPSTDRVKYSRRQVADAKRKARNSLDRKAIGDAVGTAIVDVVISEHTEEQDQAREFISRVVDVFTKAMVEAYDVEVSQLTPRQRVTLRKQVETVVSEEHMLCSICVEILRVESQLESLVTELAQAESREREVEGAHAEIPDKAVAAAEATIQKLVSDICNRVLATLALSGNDPLEAVIRAGLYAVARLLARQMLAPVNRFIRLVGVVTCPEIDKHPEVVELCLTPLLNLWPLPSLLHWVAQGFRLQDPFLRTRRSRPRASRTKRTRSA